MSVLAIPPYKGLIICGKRLRSQWMSETHRYWPQARACQLTDHRQLMDALHEAGRQRQALVVIASYHQAVAEMQTLCGLVWDDLILDEAQLLKNPGSQRSQALWKLRETSYRAVALTGTPIDRSLDDMARLVAWARNDPKMFHGSPLSKRFDLDQPGQAQALADQMGPVIFRRDRSVLKDELPPIYSETVLLDPEPAELALAQAAGQHLRDILSQITELAVKASDPAREAEIRQQLSPLRSLVPSGITLARMAASDPLAVQASDSAVAELLKRRGLVEPAVRAGGTKRQQIVGLAQELADNGESVLIFTDFARVADRLLDDLKAAGIRAAGIQGQMSQRTTDQAQEDFQQGHVSCLVLTRSAREGLNLQRATVLIHFDLPWLASEVVQRVGRASRIGASGESLQILIPVMAGTIEEQVAEKVLQRAILALQALDLPRGFDLASNELMGVVEGLSQLSGEDLARALLD